LSPLVTADAERYGNRNKVGNLWRTTDDIGDNWASMLSNLDQSAQHSAVARPGAWNDPLHARNRQPRNDAGRISRAYEPPKKPPGPSAPELVL